MNGHHSAIPHFHSLIASRRALCFHFAGLSSKHFFRLLPCFVAALLILSATSLVRAADAPEPGELFRSGKYEECVGAATLAFKSSAYIESNPLWKLRAELELGRYADAAVTFEAALKSFPRSIEIRWWGREVCRYTNQLPRVAQLNEQIGTLIQQTPGYYSDAPNRIIVGRFLLSEGLDPKKILDGAYNIIKRQQPNYVPAYLASGELALDKQDYALAAESYEKAAKLDPKETEAQFGLALAYAPSDASKADAALKAVLARNPNHIGALLMTVDSLVDSERYEDADTVLEHIAVINPHQPRAAAYRAIIAHLQNQPDRERTHRDFGLKHWTTNPEVDHLIGKKLSQKYRFAEGAEHQRAALLLDPKFLPAKMQLAQDLLRLGREAEGWKLAEEVNQADGYNVVAHNLVTLQESVNKFRTLESDGIVARMDAREAEIYGHRVLDLLKRAKQKLCAKYDVELKSPIIVEMFPKQEDFAIRTFGLPGGAGFLGVCFGTVITANSPASQGGHPTCWESTLWHEFCHVVTLQKTHNRMPRWLSEGISVYEERQADPTWGQTVNPLFRKMLLGDELTPVAELSGAFLRPASAQHLQFAYFESSLVVEFLIEKHGIDVLKKILQDLGNGITINESLVRHTGSLEELNAEFIGFARVQAEAMAPNADWTVPELPTRADPSQLSAWLTKHPKNYAALQRLARQLVAEKKWDAANDTLKAMLTLYPGDEGGDGLYPLMARVAKELNDPAAERAAWEALAQLSDDNLEMIARMTELTSQAGEWELAKKYTERWLAVNPLQPVPHRLAAAAAEKLNDDALAVDSYRALLLLDPIDAAELHLQMAKTLQRTGALSEAKRHALLAVEEAPRFRAAHRQLLDIIAATEQATPANPPPPPLPTEIEP
ncbi:MAG: Tetratricopeptide repeat protein [Planctomycetaceae bacterium]|nr:Tetratricopeptide repeat protein [Planctomycetaceae bacterium]